MAVPNVLKMMIVCMYVGLFGSHQNYVLVYVES